MFDQPAHMNDPFLSEQRDEVLVRRVVDGDEAALGTLYGRHVRAIYRFVLAHVGDPDEAEDLTADTFTRMMQAIGSFRGEASFKNWLYQIARNAVRNHRRSASFRRTGPLPLTLAAPEIASEDEARAGRAEAEGDETWDAAVAMLRPLPPRYREVLELRFISGCSIEQTADRMGVTIANAKVLQHRALKKAALIMEERHVEPARPER